MKSSQTTNLKIPEAFLDRMAGLLGDEFPAFLSSLHSPSLIGLRVNTLKISAKELQERSPFQLSSIPWCPDGFVVKADENDSSHIAPGLHPYHAAGLYYLQEPSAMAAAIILSPQPGEKVLDLAAAPGGKTTHIAALMNNSGLLVANEIHPKRVWDLAENLERCGVTHAMLTNESPQNLADHFGAYFDRILVDAPCSGEGMFRKGDIARQEWKPDLDRSCALRQSAILEQANRMLKPGGHLAYTTCTFSPLENETVIARFSADHPNYDIETIQPCSGFSSARSEWISLPAHDPLNRAVRIWPHLAPGEGHFIALLVKRGEVDHHLPALGWRISAHLRRDDKARLDKSILTMLDDFCSKNLTIQFDDSQLSLVGSRIYRIQDPALFHQDIKFIHPGWWLGSIQKGRFIPSHSLAMGISANHASQTLTLAPDDAQLAAYLAGESIQNLGPDALVLVTVDDYPVGWGKRVQNVLKNHYPHGLRRRVQVYSTQ